MATITGVGVAKSAPVSLHEQRVILRGVSWETYRTLGDEVGNATTLKAYNGGVLEFMSPGLHHEGFKTRLGYLVQVLTEELDIPCRGLGSTTWDDEGAQKGVEPDACFLLTAEKVAATHPLPGDAALAPRPDLAIEVDMRRSGVNRSEIYAALGVPEVWRFDGTSLRVDRLRFDGTYEASDASGFLPIPPSEVARWVLLDEPGDDNAWVRRFRAWVRGGLNPGNPPGAA